MQVLHGDMLDVLAGMDPASVDAVVTDPPYGLGFMGKEWDTPGAFVERKAAKRNTFDHVGGNHNPSNSADAARTRRVEGQRFQAQAEEWFTACLRVLRPGGHLLAFGGTRTAHRLTSAIEDAGFEIRDTITWLYGSGFPKSLDVGKAIDKSAGATREVVGTTKAGVSSLQRVSRVEHGYRENLTDVTPDSLDVTAPATDAARQWRGWGTGLKPAHEPIIVARKPLTGTVAACVLAHGTGALNIDGCRVGGAWVNPSAGKGAGRETANENGSAYGKGTGGVVADPHPAGRWPANVVLSHAPCCGEECAPGCPVAELDTQSGTLKSGTNPTRRNSAVFKDCYGEFQGQAECTPARGADSGGASRFFPTFRYQAKAPSKERPKVDGVAHPTVKPLALMRWLVRLVTPPGGTVLDPFAGSGTTGEACALEGFDAVLVEREAAYLPLIAQRAERVSAGEVIRW